jgi:1-acyl-sn-glycerol-3-phosphate acyltransferase
MLSSRLALLFFCFHTVLIHVWVVLGTAFFGSLAIAVSFFSRTGDAVHHVAQVWGRSILSMSGIRVELKGMDRAGNYRSCIFMCNHQSNYDIPVLLGKLPVQFRWLAKAELFRIPLFGRSMRGAGYISIDRFDRNSAFQSLDKAAATIKQGTSVMIFPEGTRSTDGKLLPFKKGGFVLAVDAGVPIVPIVISGTHDIMPKGRLLVRRQSVLVQVQPPILTSEFTRDTKAELMARVRQSMLACQSKKRREDRHA